MKTGITIVALFFFIVIICQMCINCSEDNEEYVMTPIYESKYINDCDSLQQQEIVSLSLLNFTLGDTINKKDLKSTSERLIKNLKTTKIELKTIYNFESKMEINEKKYNVKCTLITFMDQIAFIEMDFNQNVYDDLISLYKRKYGNCLYELWHYKNQTIDIDYSNPEKTEYSYYTGKTIHYNIFDFQYLRIKYYDHKLVQEIDTLEKRQKILQIQSDSIKHAKAVEIQKVIDRKKRIEEEKKISKEIKQI